MGIYLHFKLTEYIYLKNHSSLSSWDDTLLRHHHQIILLKTHEKRKFRTFTKQQEDCQLCILDQLNVVL